MKRLASFASVLMIAFFGQHGLNAQVLSVSVEELLAAAGREGVIDFYATSTLTPEGTQKLNEAFNKRYNLNIKLNYTPGDSFTRDVGKVVGLAAAGVPPELDLMVVHDAGHATLWLRKLHQPFDYAKLGVDRQAIGYDSGTVILANQFVLPAYNKQILPSQDVPKRWEDLLDPKWRGGKLGMSTATHHLARLAAAWGEKKASEFVKALAKQQPYLGEIATVYTRLQLGEILIAITMTDSFIHRAKVTGAPIVFAEGIEPVISPAYNAGVLKGARHPNTGYLFAAFLTTPEAQQIWEKYNGQTSVFVPGTPAYRYAQGKKVLYMAQEQAQTIDRLTREYGKILGFTK
ncbi:MAG: extracellular solute-binding protein [Deltaproteobacteria bacterium]|nr:extracellular solute-binding protein [Deltaproteobacteria bacterium]